MKNYKEKGYLGVCIEIKNNNYGSMLQSYATQKILQKYGIRYELISYKKKYTPLFILKSIPRVLNRVVWQDKWNENKKRIFIKKHPELEESVTKRKKAFEEFRKNYFEAPIVTYYGYNELKCESGKYSAFLTGSDQLWSPSGLPTNFYNLMFTPDKAVRISYASSFGVKEIPWYQKKRTRQYLERFQFISCREESGTEIVRQLTRENADLVVDPTLIFNAKEWDEIIPHKNTLEEKYIFSYILGTNKKYRDEVKKLSKETGLPVVSIHQYVDADLNFGDYFIEDAGPVEFVNLIRNAEYICTDSFHGSVFSILYHKKFIIFNRYSDKNKASKNTRIDNLCKNLGLGERRYSGNIVRDIKKSIKYELVEDKINGMRETSHKYLERAFDSI